MERNNFSIEEMMQRMEEVVSNMATSIENLEKEVKVKEESVVKATEELNAVREKLHKEKDKRDAIVMSLESLRMGGFVAHADNVIVEIKSETEEKIEEENNKKWSWKDHSKAFIIRLNEYDNVLDRYKTVKEAGKKLGQAYSTICRYLNLDKEWMLKHKGYYLVWEF